MREQGFEYVASDYRTVRRGMSADKILPGMSEEEFISKYGFGLSTFYTGEPPQLTTGYSPARVGLGEENVGIFKRARVRDKGNGRRPKDEGNVNPCEPPPEEDSICARKGKDGNEHVESND